MVGVLAGLGGAVGMAQALLELGGLLVELDGAAVGGQLVSMTLVGVMTSFSYWMIGLPSPFGLGLIAALMDSWAMARRRAGPSGVR